MIEYTRRGQLVTKIDTGEIIDYTSINKAKKFVRTIPQAWLKVKVIHKARKGA